ncbi:unnamed protein product [Knipowitschia caucasica]
MAENSTNLFLEILQSYDAVPVIIAFCVSVAVGLVLGAVVYVLLTWMSRRRAGSAIITRRFPRKSRSSPRARPNFKRNNSYDRRTNNNLLGASFSFQRQSSSPDRIDPLGYKTSFRGSTFHPLLQCSQIAREAEEGSPSSLPCTQTLLPEADGASEQVVLNPSRPESFWGNTSLRGFHVTQPPPPAYDSIIQAYCETRT